MREYKAENTSYVFALKFDGENVDKIVEFLANKDTGVTPPFEVMEGSINGKTLSIFAFEYQKDDNTIYVYVPQNYYLAFGSKGYAVIEAKKFEKKYEEV